MSRTDTTHAARFAIVGFALMALLPVTSAAQTNSNIASVTLQGTVASSLTVAVTAGSTVNFTLVPGAAADGSTAVTIQTAWVLDPLIGTVSLYAYFDVPAQALTDGSNHIASSLVLGRMSTGTPTSYTAFSQTNAIGPAGGGLKLFDESILILNRNKTRNDNLDLRIDLGSLPLLPAGSYSGTLRIRAQSL